MRRRGHIDDCASLTVAILAQEFAEACVCWRQIGVRYNSGLWLSIPVPPWGRLPICLEADLDCGEVRGQIRGAMASPRGCLGVNVKRDRSQQKGISVRHARRDGLRAVPYEAGVN